MPAAPLLVDDFGNDRLVKKVAGLPKASELLEAERNQHHDGYIDIERLMTSLPCQFNNRKLSTPKGALHQGVNIALRFTSYCLLNTS